MQKSLRVAKQVGFGYLINCAVTVFLQSTIPLLTDKNLPIPFSLFDLGRLHAAIYFLQIWGMSHSAATNSALDFLAYNFMCIINGQAKVLNEKIRTSGNLQNEEDLIEHLNNCVYHHNKVITLVQKVENVFSMILLIQYLASIVAICNIGFQLVNVKIFSFQFFSMLLFLLAMMCQLGVYCWFGNEIILNSAAIRKACYDSDWVDYSVRVRKILFIIMERGKRPLYLTAGKFSILSLASFTSVINSAYSFFTLMQRMYQPSEYEI
ncbi:putative odorant receptor 92a [Anthonomus grandis grandis]|uniref:putative odorant receptor 92a n=1 Tax=Anthonomus grandis grandis TaxID=2921223 RepID=UPI0021654D53|nr:putative odorant receptor 92a [Anthonomus grandis grandis]